MPTLNISGQNVQVDDSFMKLSPDAQNATVDEIAKSLGGQQTQPAQQSQSDGTTPLADIAKSGAVGLGEGMIGLAGLPADLTNLAAKGADYLSGSNLEKYTQPLADYAGGNALQGYVEKATGGPFYQPKTAGGDVSRTIGQFIPAIVGGPESFGTKLATRVLAPALASEAAGAATHGTSAEPYARAAGAILGAASPVGLSRVISPTTIDAANAGAIKTLQDAGVTALTAGQKSGSRALKYVESELGDSFGAGNQATKANELAHEQFTQAALGKAGIDAPRATPEVMDQAFNDNSSAFNSIAARNPSIPLPGFQRAADEVVSDFKSATNASEAPTLQGFIDRINGKVIDYPADKQPLVDQLRQQGVPEAEISKFVGGATATKSGAISGEAYQNVQSRIAAAARSATDPNLKRALYDLRSALDESVQNGLKSNGNAADAAAWNDARQQYKSLLVLERAISGTGEQASKGLITPAALGNADKAVSGRRNVVRGNTTFGDLARAGNAVMKPLPQSGTAPRAAAHLLPSILGAAALGGVGDLTGVVGGAAMPAILGRAMFTRPMQAYLSNQKAVPLRQIPLGRNLVSSGILSLPAAQRQQPSQ